MAQHPGAATRDFAQAQQHQDRRRLSGPIRAEQTEDLALGHGEGNAVDRLGPSVTFAEIFCFDDDVVHRRPNLATAPTMISSAAPIMPTPTMPQTVEVETVVRKLLDAVSPRDEARNVSM